VQLPCFNERAVVRRVIEAVAAFDWPRDKLHIQVLDDSTDDTPVLADQAIAAVRALGIDAVSMRRSHRSGYKAGALQAGLERSTAEFVAVFDADFIPAPDFLRRCMRPLLAEPRIAFVGARWDHINGDANALTRAQQRIKDCDFGVVQMADCWAGNLVYFDGTCGIWRRRAIDEAGGWRAEAFSEDTDLSVRVQLEGWRGLRLASVGVPGELPESMDAWLKQQANWSRGTGTVLRLNVLGIWRGALPFRSKLAATLLLGTDLLGPALIVAVLSGAIELLLSRETAFTIALASIAAVFVPIMGGAVLVKGQVFLRGADPRAEWVRSLTAIAAFAHSQISSAIRIRLESPHKEKVATPKTGAGAAPGSMRNG
jgi:cellulose synthase/poly-beta-1,6-N-acetylglucosamine synthase-like glycosyltransferase